MVVDKKTMNAKLKTMNEEIILIVNGDQKATISCKPEEKESVAKILGQLGVYAAFHGYNFQFMNN